MTVDERQSSLGRRLARHRSLRVFVFLFAASFRRRRLSCLVACLVLADAKTKRLNRQSVGVCRTGIGSVRCWLVGFSRDFCPLSRCRVIDSHSGAASLLSFRASPLETGSAG